MHPNAHFEFQGTTARGIMRSKRTKRFLLLLASQFSYDPLSISLRYSDAMVRKALPFPICSPHLPAVERFATLNEYILDGYLYDTVSCYKTSPHPLGTLDLLAQIPSHPSRNASWLEISNQIAIIAFRIRAAQAYYDGNHRTATAYILETCCDFGRQLKVDPLLLYHHLSCRDYWVLPQDAIAELTKLILKAQPATVSIEDREHGLLGVKELPVRVSASWALVRRLSAGTVRDAVTLLRVTKLQTPRDYHLLRITHAREIAYSLSRKRSDAVDDVRKRKQAFMNNCSKMGIDFIPSEG